MIIRIDNWKSQWYYKNNRKAFRYINTKHSIFPKDRSREVTDKEYSKLHNVIIYSSRIPLI